MRTGAGSDAGSSARPTTGGVRRPSVLAMNPTRSHLTALATVLGGAAYAFTGALQVSSGDFGGTHNTLDSTAEYLVTGALPVALVATAPAWRALGTLARAPRVALAAIVPQIVIALMCVVSVVNGEDAAFFNAVAPVAMLVLLVSSVTLGVKLRRSGSVPTAVAAAIPLMVPVTFALSPLGGPLVTGAFFLAVGSQSLRQSAPFPAAA